MQKKPHISIEELIRRDGRYPLAAVQFVREGLNYTVSKVHPKAGEGERRHVTGEQLCLGLREIALKKWGYMAKSVLNKWHIEQTRDFGEIVFIMVNSGWMHKEPTDSVDDFNEVYEFAYALVKNFRMVEKEPDEEN